MGSTDSIADFLTIIRNASRAKKDKLDCPSSKMREHLAGIFKKCGYIKNYRRMQDSKQGMLRIYLKYSSSKDQKPAITNLKRVSKPGLRRYVSADKIPSVLGGLGMAVISTSKGVFTDKECKDEKVGGEVICYIW